MASETLQRKCPIVDGLRYEGGALMDAAANEIDRLRKENEALLKDAERWRKARILPILTQIAIVERDGLTDEIIDEIEVKIK